jgi:uroporphyrinogen decarboxylase
MRKLKMKPALRNDRFLRACRRETVDVTPVWFMRQAGRYMAEYRAIRAHHSLLEICKTPALAAEVTLQPIDRLGVDAAILFADILLILEPLGVGLEFVGGDGPVLRRPLRSAGDIDKLPHFDVATELGFISESVRAIVAALDGRVPLIGFAGGPFTVASYLIEGGHSKDFATTRRLMRTAPEAWHRLMERLASVTTRYLAMQIAAGVDAVQLFDSWVGILTPDEYRTFVAPHAHAIFEALRPFDVPTIHFGTNTSELLGAMREAGGSVIGIDWRIDLAEGWRRAGTDVAVQGNLDPKALLGPAGDLRAAVLRVLDSAAGRAGHVFNLGHGIVPETPVDAAADVVKLVHETTARRASSALPHDPLD